MLPIASIYLERDRVVLSGSAYGGGVGIQVAPHTLLMNISPSLRLIAWGAIALSPLGFASTALAAPGSFVVPTVPINAPTSPSTYPRSPGSAVVIPTVPSQSPLPRDPTATSPIWTPPMPPPKVTNPPISSPGKLPPLPNRPNTPPIAQPPISNGKLAYRVIVNSADVARVSAVVPGAFRTTVNGQSVIQVGLFGEQSTANELQQTLRRSDLQATILPVTVNQMPAPLDPTLPTYPIGTSPGKLPPLPNRPNTLPIARPPSNSKLVYRVIVNSADVARVSAVVPGAFRTTVNGQSVVQVGLFSEQSTANELQQTLRRSNLQATILPIQASELPANQPPPSTSPSRNPNSAPLPIPKSGITVVIDPGHGGGDPGAVGIRGLQEKEVTLAVSQQVVALLKQKGVNAVLTRSRDQELELEPRVDFAEQAKANVFVSIHANSFDANRTDVNGIETYYYSGTGQSLARTIQTNLLQELGARDRGVKQANFYVIRYTPMPAALVEIGFVTGAEDAARLASATGRSKIAQAIARAILQYVQ
jgi:N-acetylmuramoyl-L-alanine amidase